MVGYTASKTGVLGLTRALAHFFGKDSIRVNAISPGYRKTDMTKALWGKPVSQALTRATSSATFDFASRQKTQTRTRTRQRACAQR